MFSKMDKAGAGAIGAGITTALAAFLDIEVAGAIGTIVTAILVYLAPNKDAANEKE
jgi:hypothetical protein